MKKIYNNPTLKVLAVDAEDIITASGYTLKFDEENPNGYGNSRTMDSFF